MIEHAQGVVLCRRYLGERDDSVLACMVTCQIWRSSHQSGWYWCRAIDARGNQRRVGWAC